MDPRRAGKTSCPRSGRFGYLGPCPNQRNKSDGKENARQSQLCSLPACPSCSRLLGPRGSRLPGTSVTAGLTVRRLGHGLEDLVDDLVGADSLGVGIEVGEDAMAEHGAQDGADVAGADSQAAVQDPADRRQTRRRHPRPARAGPRFPDQGPGQPVRGASRISVPARGRGCERLHGGRLAASGIGQARTDSAGGARLRGDRTVSGDRRQAPARVLGRHRRRSASGRERLALGSRSVSLGFDASAGRPAQNPLELRRWTDQHVDRSTAHLPASGPVHGDDEGLRRIRITGNH